MGNIDIIVGINLLREGLDLPEVSFIGILDADKQGFLRSRDALIQTIGRTSRNVNGHVVMYADRMTAAMKGAIDETSRRRSIQLNYNEKHGITPHTIIKPIREKVVEIKDTKHIPKQEIPNLIIELEVEMRKAADKLDFELAIALRDKIQKLNERIKKK